MPIAAKDLREHSFFSPFSDEALGSLADMMERQAWDAETWLVEQGVKQGGVFFLLEGRARIERSLPDERALGLSALEPGTVFGILSVLDGGNRAARVVAETNVVCAELSRDAAHALIHGDSPLALKFQMACMRVLFRDLRKTNQRLVELMTLPEASLHLERMNDWLSGLG